MASLSDWTSGQFKNLRKESKPKILKICKYHRLLVTASFAFCVISIEPIEVQTRSAPQNDRLNLRFVKKMVRNGQKTAKRAGKWRRFP
jgi:hypothetical protein